MKVQDEYEGVKRRRRSKTNMKERDEDGEHEEDGGVTQILRSKTKTREQYDDEEQDEYEGVKRRRRSKTNMKERDEDGEARRRWRSNTKIKEQDEDEGAIR